MSRLSSSQESAVSALMTREAEEFQRLTPRSLALCRRAVNASMPLGVPTNVCSLDPYPVAIHHGDGAWLTDVDGTRRVDYHGGFGTMVFGHAHPDITKAIAAQSVRGVHFGAMHEAVVPWAEHLCERYGLDWIRFCQSGTEATMDAIRIARARTQRTRIAKIEGGYHGSHETALVSMNMALDAAAGPDHRPFPRAGSEGLSPRLLREVEVLPFNDLDAAESALRGERIAAVLVEPILMNVGSINPLPGYLQGLRELCDRHGSLLIFDETKTGASIAWGGASEVFGVIPHLRTLGKGIGGGVPCAAVGDTDGSCFELIQNWQVPHLGTFGGNPLAASAGLAAMEKVLTKKAFAQLDDFGATLRSRLDAIISAYDLPAYSTGIGAKGCVVWCEEPQRPLRDYRDYQRRYHFDLGYLCWLYLMNRHVFLAPGQDEQWTHTVSHSQAEQDAFVSAFADLAQELSAALHSSEKAGAPSNPG